MSVFDFMREKQTPPPIQTDRKSRDYQREAISKSVGCIMAGDDPLLVMPTGTGKTVVATGIIEQSLRLRGGAALALAHREELLHQMHNTFREWIPHRQVSWEVASQHAEWYANPDIVISSVPTQSRGRRYAKSPKNYFNLIWTDEAHHGPASSYRETYAHYMKVPGTRHFGVTATPKRLDKLGLRSIYNVDSFVMLLTEAIARGWLVPMQFRQTKIKVDFGHIKAGKDLTDKKIAETIGTEEILHEIHQTIIHNAGDKCTMVFVPAGNVQDDSGDRIVERLTEIFNRQKPGCARFLADGITNPHDRKQIVRDYKNGRFQFLINCMICTEGFDHPGIECVAIARPTASSSLYRQMIGRGTRPLPQCVNGIDRPEDRIQRIAESSKPKLLVLDIVGQGNQHNLTNCADVLAGDIPDPLVARRVKEILEADQETDRLVDPSEIVSEAMQDIQKLKEQQAERRREILGRTIEISNYDLDPFAATLDIVTGMRVKREFRAMYGRPVSEKQIEQLKKMTVPQSTIDALPDRAAASKLLDLVFERAKEGKAWYIDVHRMLQAGITEAWDLNKAEAKAALKMIKKERKVATH